eukprot:5097943-Lingulodinium_polyedra.AAC.1
MAATRAEDWRGRVILYVGDNSNVDRWLANRKSSNRCARFLLQVLGAMEASYQFGLNGSYTRTYHNVTADALTRLDAEAVDQLLQGRGLARVDLEPAWAAHLDRGWLRRAMVWDGQDGSDRQLALQLAEARAPAASPRAMAPRPGSGPKV